MSDKPKLEFEDDDEEFLPQTPREKPPWWKGDDPRDKEEPLPEITDMGPILSPDSPRPDGESDDEEPEDPSAEIIQLEDLDDATVSQHRKGYIKYINEIFYERIKAINTHHPSIAFADIRHFHPANHRVQ